MEGRQNPPILLLLPIWSLGPVIFVSVGTRQVGPQSTWALLDTSGGIRLTIVLHRYSIPMIFVSFSPLDASMRFYISWTNPPCFQSRPIFLSLLFLRMKAFFPIYILVHFWGEKGICKFCLINFPFILLLSFNMPIKLSACFLCRFITLHLSLINWFAFCFTWRKLISTLKTLGVTIQNFFSCLSDF